MVPTVGFGALGLSIAAVLLGSQEPLVQQIEWNAAEGCPAQAAVVAATREFLGGRALADFPRAVVAQAWVEVAQSGYRLRLTITVDGVREHHELRAVDCDQIGRDAALLIASAVDPFALGPPAPKQRQLVEEPVIVQRPSTRPTLVVATKPVPASEPIPPASIRPAQASPAQVSDRPHEREREPKSRQPITGTLALAGLGFVGLFPRASGGIELEGGLQRGLFRWQLAAAGWFGGRFRVGSSEVGGDLSAVSVSTGFCVAPSWQRVRFAACAVAGAGPIIAQSINTRGDRTTVQPWAFAGPDLRVTWTPRPRLGLFFGVAALPALVRPGWSVSNPDGAFQVPPVLGLLRAGIELGQLGRNLK